MNLYIEIALAINRDMFESKYIPYKIYQITEDALLKKVKDTKINKNKKIHNYQKKQNMLNFF